MSELDPKASKICLRCGGRVPKADKLCKYCMDIKRDLTKPGASMPTDQYLERARASRGSSRS